MLSDFATDLRYAARTLLLNPAFALTAICAIALGIGINAGIFSVLNGFILRELQTPAASDLVAVHQVVEGARDRSTHGTGTMFSTEELESYRRFSQTLDGVMGYSPLWGITVGGASPERINGDLVTCNYFQLLGLVPVLGTGFTAANCNDATPVQIAVLGHELWQSRFGGDPGVLGKSIILNRHPFVVVGVAPAGYRGIEVVPASIFVPITAQKLLLPAADYYGSSNTAWLMMLGRRKSGVGNEQIQKELSVHAAQLDSQHPGRTTEIRLSRVTAFSMPRERTAILSVSAFVLGAFGLVLLIACANVANLLLARAAGRSKEIALRLSLGATRGRLIRQMMTESLLIAFLGGAAGSALALWVFWGGSAAVLSSLPSQFPRISFDAGPDARVLLFALVLTTITGFAFGLVPAIQASRASLAGGLKEDSAGGGRRTAKRLRGALVGVQAFVCMLLLVMAGLLLHGLYEAQTVEPGFEYRNVAGLSYDLRGAGYTQENSQQFQSSLISALRTVPGVTGVSLMETPPLSLENNAGMFGLPGQPQTQTQFNTISPDYFSLLGLPIVLGRNFTSADFGTRGPVIVTEAMARRYWPGQNPLGQKLQMGTNPQTRAMLEVVGVVRDAQIVQVGSSDTDMVYFPSRNDTQLRQQLLVRSAGNLSDVRQGILAKAQEVDPELVVTVTPLEDFIDVWKTLARLVAGLSGSLAALALVLAGIGIYGVVSYAVSRRMRELGIRMALGATGSQVARLLLQDSLRPVFIGAFLGIVVAAAASRILQAVLFGVSPLDPLAFVGAGAFLLSAALAASLIPAYRALQLDPMVTLRHD